MTKCLCSPTKRQSKYAQFFCDFWQASRHFIGHFLVHLKYAFSAGLSNFQTLNQHESSNVNELGSETNFSAAIKASHYSSTAAENDGVQSAVTVDIRLVKTNPRPFESVLKCHSYMKIKGMWHLHSLCLGIKINGSNSPLQRAQRASPAEIFSLGGH
jgi:hypothetical protein